MLLGFSEGSVGNRPFALADSNGAGAAHRLQRFGNYVVTVSGQLVVIGHRVAIQICFFARRKGSQRLWFEGN
jgi:hypothetical protein